MEQKINSENLSAENQTDGAPVLSPAAMHNLVKMKNYMNIMCIIYYIVAGFVVLLTLINIGIGLSYQGRYEYGIPGSSNVSVISIFFAIGIAAILFFLGSWLRDAVKACKKFGENPHDIGHLETAIRCQSGYWKMIVIVILVILGIQLLALFFFTAFTAFHS
ncbi:MAG: hypothetical protein LBP85_01350 [Prevotellaceae bacterium]|jgi:hypothetical protein|nr:hypothetical protein [Prevotellaceae bacterium]